MSLDEDLVRIATDPEMFKRAVRRAGSRELAADAIQETVRAIAGRKSPDAIENLRGFFYVALIREIDHQLARPAAIPAADIIANSDCHQADEFATGARRTNSLEQEVHLRVLAKAVLSKLDSGRDGPTPLISARSADPAFYRSVIVRAAKQVFELLMEGDVTNADWNEILEVAYPQWFDEQGLTRDAKDQRLSRGRRDVQSLLRSVLSRDQLAF